MNTMAIRRVLTRASSSFLAPVGHKQKQAGTEKSRIEHRVNGYCQKYAQYAPTRPHG